MSKAIQDANKRASGAAPHTAPPAVGASDVDIEVGDGGARPRPGRAPARNGRAGRRTSARNAGMAVIAARRAQRGRGGPRRGPAPGARRGGGGSGGGGGSARMQRVVRRGRVIRKTPRGAGSGRNVRRMDKRPPSQRALEHSNNESDSERQVEMRTGAASDSYSD